MCCGVGFTRRWIDRLEYLLWVDDHRCGSEPRTVPDRDLSIRKSITRAPLPLGLLIMYLAPSNWFAVWIGLYLFFLALLPYAVSMGRLPGPMRTQPQHLLVRLRAHAVHSMLLVVVSSILRGFSYDFLLWRSIAQIGSISILAESLYRVILARVRYYLHFRSLETYHDPIQKSFLTFIMCTRLVLEEKTIPKDVLKIIFDLVSSNRRALPALLLDFEPGIDLYGKYIRSKESHMFVAKNRCVLRNWKYGPFHHYQFMDTKLGNQCIVLIKQEYRFVCNYREAEALFK